MPIYVQLALKIKIDMFVGRLKPGDKLPSVRDFACDFQVNPNTVQKALNLLEMEGLIFTERTNGKYVTWDQKLINKAHDAYARELTCEYENKMKAIGLKVKGGKWFKNF